MNKTKLVARINEEANSLSGVIDLLYRYIMDKEEQQRRKSFEWVLTDISLLDLEKTDWGDYVPELEEMLRQGNIAVEMATKKVTSLVQQHTDKEDFYDVLWTMFTDDNFLSTVEDKKAFLLTLWLDSRIPYFKVGEGIEMDEDEYSQRRIKLAEVLSKATFITSLKMKQKTKKASLLAEEADLLQDERDKAVYWSIVMSAIEAQAESRTIQRMTIEQREKELKSNEGNN